MIDVAVRETGILYCQPIVDLYDAIVGAPTFDVSESDAVVQWAYDCHRQAVDIFSQGARDMTGNCRDWLADPQPGTVPFQQWGLGRQEINNALAMLIPAIDRLEEEGY